MKSILIADNRTDLLATLEPILKHWGYRVLSTQAVEQVTTFLEESNPSLLIISEDFLAPLDKTLDKKARAAISSKDLPMIALRHEAAKTSKLKPNETLDVPVELFELFSFIQRQVEKHPRQNLRLRLRLPGMYSIEEEEFILADVLTLSMRGLFFKAAAKVEKGDRINVVFPLFGQGKEIDVTSTVLYSIQPEAENNYFQGFGVGFDDLSDEEEKQLQRYIKEHFLKEVSSSYDGVADFNKEQLKD
jgi:Tfp pilus assembly protein PilZ